MCILVAGITCGQDEIPSVLELSRMQVCVSNLSQNKMQNKRIQAGC